MEDVTRDNAAVLFLDVQKNIVRNSRTVTVDGLRRSTGALAKLAALHRLPAFLSAVASGGDFLRDVLRPLGNPKPRPRTFTTAFADTELVDGLRATGRTVLVLCGVASEIVVQRTALDALAAGFAVHVAVDACGGVDARTEDAAWRRITAAGAVTTSVTTIAAELAGDFKTDAGAATLKLLYESIKR